MKHLQHQTQPTGNTCASACAAMLLGKPVHAVARELHDKYLADPGILHQYLRDRGCTLMPAVTEGPAPEGFTGAGLEPDHVYLLSVPSLNLDATMHFILLDTRDDVPVSLFDPNKGRDGKRYYVDWFVESPGPLEVKLGGYVVHFRIDACPAIAEQERAA